MKTKIQLLSIAFAISGLVACSKDDIEKEQDTQTTTQPTGAPVETATANTNYPPAFAGQTRVNSVKTVTPYQATLLTSSLSSPWGNCCFTGWSFSCYGESWQYADFIISWYDKFCHNRFSYC